MLRRRALLASLGTAVVAGCVADDGTSPQTDGTATDSPTRTEPTETATPSAPKPPSSIDTDWRFPAYDAGNSNRTEAGGPTAPIAELWSVTADSQLSQPVLAEETLYVGRRDGAVLTIDARTGEKRWQQSVGDKAFTPHVVAGLVCVPTGAAIVALDPADGSEQWRTDIGDPWSRRLFASEYSVFVSTSHNAPDPWRLAVETGAVETEPPGSGADFEAEWFYRDGTRYSVGPIFGPTEVTPVDGGHDWSTDLFGKA